MSEEQHEAEIFDRLPFAREAAHRTERKRKELEKPYQHAVQSAIQVVASLIAQAGDRGQSSIRFPVSDISVPEGNGVSRLRVLKDIRQQLHAREFEVYLSDDDDPDEAELQVSWRVRTPDYRHPDD